MKHGSAATRTPDDIDAITCAGLEIHVIDGLHPAETQACRSEPVQADGSGNLPADARVEEREVATHVVLARRGLVDEQLKTLAGRADDNIRHQSAPRATGLPVPRRKNTHALRAPPVTLGPQRQILNRTWITSPSRMT